MTYGFRWHLVLSYTHLHSILSAFQFVCLVSLSFFPFLFFFYFTFAPRFLSSPHTRCSNFKKRHISEVRCSRCIQFIPNDMKTFSLASLAFGPGGPMCVCVCVREEVWLAHRETQTPTVRCERRKEAGEILFFHQSNCPVLFHSISCIPINNKKGQVFFAVKSKTGFCSVVHLCTLYSFKPVLPVSGFQFPSHSAGFGLPFSFSFFSPIFFHAFPHLDFDQNTCRQI